MSQGSSEDANTSSPNGIWPETLGLLRFASDRIETQFLSGRMHPKLAWLLLAVAQDSFAQHGYRPMLTSIYRTPSEDSAVGGHGIHSTWRACDIRVSDMSDKVRDTVFATAGRFVYDPDRPALAVAILEQNAIAGPHIHLQVHHKTQEKT